MPYNSQDSRSYQLLFMYKDVKLCIFKVCKIKNLEKIRILVHNEVVLYIFKKRLLYTNKSTVHKSKKTFNCI